MRIPTDRPAGLLRLLYHQPDGCERDLLDARANASELPRDQAFRDHASYLANVWMPRHPVRAAIESRLPEREDRQARRPERELEAG
jgi:hypothetical protein